MIPAGLFVFRGNSIRPDDIELIILMAECGFSDRKSIYGIFPFGSYPHGAEPKSLSVIFAFGSYLCLRAFTGFSRLALILMVLNLRAFL